MKTMTEEKVIDGVCPTCGHKKPPKPICGFCGDSIADWPDNPEQFLLDKG